VPTERFRLFRLAQGFEQANAAAVGIEAVDVVEDEGLMPMPPSELFNALRE
jgi:hypothetical protein